MRNDELIWRLVDERRDAYTAFFADREMATPAGDSLQIAAAFHVADVADALCLNAAQIQQLKRITN